MTGENETCERCGGEVDPQTGLCGACDEPAPPWLLKVVYVLLGLFVMGLVYRLIWP